MDEIELFRQIVASCDEALKDVFLRRMEASVRIARAKLSRGESVYSASDEQQLLRSMSSGLSLELQSKARSLWKALLRMSRNRQYRVFLELDESLRLNHEHDMTTQLPQGPCVCTADLVEDVETLLGAQAVTAPTVDQALEDVAQGRQSWCAVSLRGVYKTDWLYDHLDAKKLYLNRILPAADGEWLHFDYVPGEIEIRRGGADVTGRLCVIGSKLDEENLAELFHLA